jgi:outer membrane protein
MYTKITVVAHLLWTVVALMLSFAAHAQDQATDLDQMYSDVPLGAEGPSAWHGFLGAGVLATQQAAGDSRSLLVPLLSVSYQDIAYWQIARGGVWLLKSDDRTVRAGVAIRVRRGYDPADFEGLAGMEERDRSLEGGVNAVWATRPITISAAYYTDVSGKSDGDSATLSFAHPFRVSERWRITPSVGAEWLDADVVDYYYGVKLNEATASRPAYAGKASANVRVGLSVKYALTRNWSLFGGVGYTRLGSGIADSPIVIHDTVTALQLGGGWRF